MIIDSDLDMVPADAAITGLADAVACNAMVDPVESSELFDVDMDKFAGLLTLITRIDNPLKAHT
jgi:hypothetical protein